jgi:hypothetical protein
MANQLERVKIRLGIPDADISKDDLLDEFLESAKQDILLRRYPFGGNTILEPQYINLQVDLAVIRYNMQGVEGQASHSENGINRQYDNKLLSQIIPLAKVPWTEEEVEEEE